MTGTGRHTWFGVARAVAPDERLDREGGAVVLLGTSVLRLSAVAAALVDGCAQGWTDPTALTQELVARFGAPDGDAEATTRSLLLDLADAGLVELR